MEPNKNTSVFLRDTCKLGQVVKIHGGYSFQSSAFTNRGIPIIRISNIDNDQINLKNSVVFYEEIRNLDENFIAKDGDLLIAMSGATTGKAGVYKNTNLAYINQRVGKFVVTKSDKVIYKYLSYWVSSNHFTKQLSKYLASGAQPNISPKNIEDMDIVLPDTKTQEKIIRTLDAISNNISNLEALVSKQESIKKTTEFLLLQPRNSWRTIRVSECLDYEQPGKYIIHTDIIPMLRNIPVLTANKSFVIGYTEESDNIYDKGPVIIYDDFTMDMKYVTFAFKVKSSAIKLLTAKPGYDLYFIYSLLKQLNLSQQEHARSYISKVERMYIKIPDLDEQKQIAEQLKKLDQQLEHLRSELDKYRSIKNGLMDYFFD